MRVCILVPSEGYLAQAGVRIRYQRIRNHLAEIGTELTFTVLDDFKKAGTLDSDAYIFSKCYDARGPLVANTLTGAGKLVGVDFFDDYFSQLSDGRFEHLRETTRLLAPMLDFTLCSTARMEEVARNLVPDRPCHVLNDPYEDFDPVFLGAVLDSKIERARSESCISLAWFGIGENDHFRVGLRDLVAFCGEIERLDGGPFKPRLTILTNRKALTAPYLRMLNRIAVPFRVEEWSEQGEQALLMESLVCFLPVNGQPFSIAKSLNRCVTALTRGAQVLSSGYPLYEPYDKLLYRQPHLLVRDLQAGRLALRSETVGELAGILKQWSSPQHEADKLARFLLDTLIGKRDRMSGASDVPIRAVALLHGAQSTGASHKLAQRLGYLSIGTPFSPSSLGYDADIQVTSTGVLELSVVKRAASLLDPELQPFLKPTASRYGRSMSGLDLTGVLSIEELPGNLNGGHVAKLRVLTSYGPLMSSFEGLIRRVFPGVETFVSEGKASLVQMMEMSRHAGIK